jgi:hypothetical protein
MATVVDSAHQTGLQKQPFKMNLPYAVRARVARKKITEYLLSPSHPDGSSKARFFSRFGFAVAQWTILAEALEKHGRTHPVVSSVESKHGTRYTVDGHLLTPDGREPRIRTVWMLPKNSKSPRLITAYPI